MCVFVFSPHSLLLGFYLRKIELATLTLAAPLNSVAGLCGPALCPGLVLLLSLSGWALWPGFVSGRAVPKQLEALEKYTCIRFHQHWNFRSRRRRRKNDDAVWGLCWYNYLLYCIVYDIDIIYICICLEMRIGGRSTGPEV